MAKITAGWPSDWIEEYREMMFEVLAEASDSTSRIDAFLEKLDDAIQAHRQWAEIVAARIRRRGAGAVVSAFAKEQAEGIVFDYNGDIMMMSPIVGFTKTDDTGDKFVEQALMTFVSWDELRSKRSQDLMMLKAYSAKIALLDKLLALEELAPGAQNPVEACQALGISLDDYLAGPMAA